MTVENQTVVAVFVLTGLTERPELQVPLFLVFFTIYLITMVGNLGLIALIWKDPHLHTPMYLFLGSLAFADACASSSVTPKMLVNFLSKDHRTFLVECFTQFYFFGSSATTECFLLSVMAYDRYVAICNPLLYPVMMSNSLCMKFIHVSYIVGFLHSAIHVGLLVRLNFCKSNIIHYFYCEILQLFKISCTDPTMNVLLVLIFSALIQGLTFMTIIVSYFSVLLAILKTKSERGRRKAFSTCSAHLLSVSLFYGTLFLMYVRPGSGSGEDKDRMYSLFYTIIIPFLNPFIYSLRNKEVTAALRRKMK
ncbi:olfactory receptor family 5 subfamily AC member 16 [Mus musculus]|uniref:Olfactory receptor n=1 Tax=Mus musculus TaxID=10090 RepID=Q7TS40_MOUSE|nr:olfactory receptor family 5 subfamily AC member 16 [Mus musculus]AAI47216.1 Olfactory receptor 198 [Mus musculus]AAP70786.1 olfactory receptor Olfr198 [Mus musculus]EDK98212.1 olfactory receptor 198 [Mus musculus]|eukprot:NP_001011808.1 olfactory receptor 198 [Mus musculus]